MDRGKFWKIIDASRKKAAGDEDAQVEGLRQQLRALSLEEVLSFHAHFGACERAANRNDVYAAAAIIDGFWVSDDAFEYFRYWLIAQGRKVFDNALRDPDSLAQVVDEGAVCEFEAFGYVSAWVWEEKTGKTMDNMPVQEGTPRKEEEGPAWKDDADLMRRFPKLWQKFSDKDD
jgi:hypothetical protein